MPDVRDLAAPAVIAVAMPALAYALMGTMPLAVFALAFGGGFLLYAATLWPRPIDTRKLLVPYLLTAILFILHVFEEYLTGFQHVAAELSGRPVTQANFLAIAGFLAPVLWLSGAVVILLGWRIGDFFVCMFFFAMTVAELSHFLFPLLIDGTFHYESGMYTAALPLIPAGYGLWLMAREMRRPDRLRPNMA